MEPRVGFLPGLRERRVLRLPSLPHGLELGDGGETWWIILGS